MIPCISLHSMLSCMVLAQYLVKTMYLLNAQADRQAGGYADAIGHCEAEAQLPSKYMQTPTVRSCSLSSCKQSQVIRQGADQRHWVLWADMAAKVAKMLRLT